MEKRSRDPLEAKENMEWRMGSEEQQNDHSLPYTFKIMDTIHENSITIICSNTSGEFDDWIRSRDVEDILLEINDSWLTSI